MVKFLITAFWENMADKSSLLRVVGSRAFVHAKRHVSMIEEKAGEGVLPGYDSDSPVLSHI